MKNILLPFLLLTSNQTLSESYTYDYKIIRVVDGDTVVIEAPYLPKPLKQEISLRVIGIDTPEKDGRSHCDNENNLAHKASDFTKNAIDHAHNIKIQIIDEDKYFRLLGDVIIDGERLSEMLVNNGLAREYHGEKKQSWCILF